VHSHTHHTSRAPPLQTHSLEFMFVIVCGRTARIASQTPTKS
jgi:hypothetical protein